MTATLVKDPVYLQLNRALRELILNGEIAVGDRFPTERQVSTDFGVSRPTANKAISSLVAEGILESRRGMGTFVRARPLEYDLKSLVSFTGKTLAAGTTPQTRLLGWKTLKAAQVNPQVVNCLQLPEDGEVYFMERLRLADELPVIFERRYVVAKYCPDLVERDLLGSLYDLWTQKYRLEIIGADQAIRAVCIPEEDAEFLEVPKASAGFLVTSTGYLRSREPLWWEQTLYRGDTYEFRNQLGPIQSTGPTGGMLCAFGQPSEDL
jgi:GntR family transcriptional regulator